MQTKRVLTGTRPTGIPHLGNYFGAYLPAKELGSKHELYFFIADLNSLNQFTPHKGDEVSHLRKAQTLDMAASILAIELPETAGHFYLQSQVPEILELFWILSCFTNCSVLQRAHTYKDLLAKGEEINGGVFNYPMLMAADILLFEPDFVPVGKDQKQHLEMTRDVAHRINHYFEKEIFKIPEPLISEDLGIIPGLDGEKMSKSKGNTIPLFASPKEWKKQVMAIETDSLKLEDPKDPESCYVYQIYKRICPDQEAVEAMADQLKKGGYGYGHAKLTLLEAIEEQFGPMRDRFFALRPKESDLIDFIFTSSNAVRQQAQNKMRLIRDQMGILQSKP